MITLDTILNMTNMTVAESFDFLNEIRETDFVAGKQALRCMLIANKVDESVKVSIRYTVEYLVAVSGNFLERYAYQGATIRYDYGNVVIIKQPKNWELDRAKLDQDLRSLGRGLMKNGGCIPEEGRRYQILLAIAERYS
jgi:hypothetical protein